MNFIDIKRRVGRDREADTSSLLINDTDGGLQVIGNLPHGCTIRPASAIDRDTLVAHLNALEFPNEPDDYETAKLAAGRSYCGPLEEEIIDYD